MAAEDADMIGRHFKHADFGAATWRVVDVHAEPGNPRPDLVWIQNDKIGARLIIAAATVRANLLPTT